MLYINELKENIKSYRNKYNYLEDKGLMCDLMKIEMRGLTTAYTKKIAESRRNEEQRHIVKHGFVETKWHC